MKIKHTIFLLSLVTLFFSACKKEGPPGPAGKDGNANVIASNTLTLSNWSTDYDDGTEFNYSSGILWSAITQDIKDNGVVMMYFHGNTTTNWTALPYSESGNGYSDALNFVVATGQVTFSYEGFDNSGSVGASALNGYFTVRIVAIPSAVRKANPHLNLNDYQAVKVVFHLKD
jgi:hypothetical protein